MQRTRPDAQQEDDSQQSDQDGQGKTIYAYRTDDGGLFLSYTKVEEDEPEPPADQEVEAGTCSTTTPNIWYLLHVLFLLVLFVGLDNADAISAQFAPIVSVTLTPVVKSVSTTATLSVGGPGADIHGRVLSPLTLTQSASTTATGHGHQDATQARGQIIYFNGSFAAQTMYAGTVYTGADGVQVVTDQPVTIPAANPPYVGQATVPAHALHAGANGNIPYGDISITGNTLQVKNTQFHDGRDERDFIFIKKEDIQGVVSLLTPTILSSEQAALTAQLATGESLLSPVCTPHTTPNHTPGDEAANVTVTMSETCAALAYNTQEFQTKSTQLLTAQQAASFQQYQRVGEVHSSILSQKVNGQSAVLTVQLISTWVYQLNTAHLTALIVGKPRLEALHLLSTFQGVQTVSITGVNDNQALPTDPAHIHLLLMVQE